MCVEFSMMRSHIALPRVGLLEEEFHIFACLKKHANSEMVFDPSLPEVNMNDFPEEDWNYSILYSGDQEVPSPDMPKPRGRGFVCTTHFEGDHAGDQATRHSRTSFVNFLNSAPIYVISHKQGSCET